MDNIRKIEMVLDALNHTKDIIRDLYRDEIGHVNWNECPDEITDLLDVLIEQSAKLNNNHEKDFWWNK